MAIFTLCSRKYLTNGK